MLGERASAFEPDDFRLDCPSELSSPLMPANAGIQAFLAGLPLARE
jgi:hypothetical protein